tara:strand:+ start:592 stop:732 length:141 start_codon:yes stop_codon:yes gene_type:complete
MGSCVSVALFMNSVENKDKQKTIVIKLKDVKNLLNEEPNVVTHKTT